MSLSSGSVTGPISRKKRDEKQLKKMPDLCLWPPDLCLWPLDLCLWPHVLKHADTLITGSHIPIIFGKLVILIWTVYSYNIVLMLGFPNVKKIFTHTQHTDKWYTLQTITVDTETDKAITKATMSNLMAYYKLDVKKGFLFVVFKKSCFEAEAGRLLSLMPV